MNGDPTFNESIRQYDNRNWHEPTVRPISVQRDTEIVPGTCFFLVPFSLAPIVFDSTNMMMLMIVISLLASRRSPSRRQRRG